MELARSLGPHDTALVLVSGGGSACVELPAPGVTLDDLIRANRELLASGLPIGEINRVRKRLSALKDGGALRRVRGRVLVLLLSDVPGDDPATMLKHADIAMYAAKSAGRNRYVVRA